MKAALRFVLIALLLAWGAAGPAEAQAPNPEAKPPAAKPEAKPAAARPAAARLQPPKITLERVEIASYFPYAPPPARVPLVLAFIFTIQNPNGVAVSQEDMKFTYAFEAKPGEFFDLNTPTVHEVAQIPPKATNQLRVVSVLDSAIVPASLAVASGYRVQQLGLKPAETAKAWWGKASLLSPLEGVFPAK